MRTDGIPGEGERFILDAELLDVISSRAFRARLGNGHEMVAFGAPELVEYPKVPGGRVRVEMSPCDMSKGRIVGLGE